MTDKPDLAVPSPGDKIHYCHECFWLIRDDNNTVICNCPEAKEHYCHVLATWHPACEKGRR
jgi:hypothetical protein